MDGDSLAVWFENGCTALFEGVENFKVDRYGTTISFSYFGKSTQVRRYARFDNISGYAFTRYIPQTDADYEPPRAEPRSEG